MTLDEIAIYDQDGTPHRFAIVNDGRRALIRNYRATNISDPGRIRTAEWQISGPIGYSRESTSGFLATAFCQNLDTRALRRLISKGARTAITLTSKDPAGVANSNKLGGFKLGDVDNKLGGAISTSDNVTHFDEQGGRLFAHRGRLSTQVRISNWTVEATTVHPEAVQGATSWFGKGRVGLGPAANMRTRTSVSATGSVYEPTQTILGDDVYTGPLAVGSDRCWFVTRSASGEVENLISYTFDDFATTTNPFQVGDPKAAVNGIGPLGPFTFIGKTTNLFSFTDQGKPVPLSRSLVGHNSGNNGKQWTDPGWGWNYAITDIGIRACTSHIDNPVGIGEAMRQFTGHNGRPTAIWAERGELFVVYQTSAGHLYAYRGVFGEQTGANGQPDFYPWWYKASTSCEAVFSTNTPADTALVWGEGTHMAYETIARDGRDDLFTSRVYDTGGGVWYGTELDRAPHLIKVLRLARLHTKNITSGSSWTLAMSFDGGDYIDVGRITTNGFHTLRPVDTGAPLKDIWGAALKPRLTQVAAGAGASSAPPEVVGTLEVEYDERPEYVTEIGVSIQLGKTGMSRQGELALIEKLIGVSTDGPVKIRLPGEREDSYAMIQNASNRRDIKPDSIDAIDLIIHEWQTA